MASRKLSEPEGGPGSAKGEADAKDTKGGAAGKKAAGDLAEPEAIEAADDAAKIAEPAEA